MPAGITQRYRWVNTIGLQIVCPVGQHKVEQSNLLRAEWLATSAADYLEEYGSVSTVSH